ncbi:MAG: D-lyxose/D-mannose family sugar isomerase [Spirochaetaceae bacterium]|nr:MAG: D-lyxose/D-mannose family sugar isomerase [Spirochaetaceae bacterium]
MTQTEKENAQKAANELFEKAGILVTEKERASVEVADFGLGNLRVEGAQILTLVQTERLGVKLLALTPGQTLPEHWHPPVGDDPGKEETVRHVYGELYVYLAGPDTMVHGTIPPGKDAVYTLRREVVMKPADQMTCAPGEKHWFQAGPSGAVVYSFSTVARDILDQFTDPDVKRQTVVQQETQS